MTRFWNVRSVITLAVAALTITTPIVAARAQGGMAPGGQSQEQKIAMVHAQLKQNFGFSDTQASAFLKKAQAIAQAYQPKIMALQKKYGNNPAPAVRPKLQAEFVPIMIEIGKKTNAALLAVATKEQRPKVQKEIERQAAMMKAMQSKGGMGGGAPAPH